MKIKSIEEIMLIQKSALLVSKTLGMLAKEIKPGINTLYLDKLAHEFICDNHGKPGFLGLYNFPYTICASPNEQVVHGLPNNNILEDGDILSIDCGVLMNGYYGDSAFTFSVGEINQEKQKLLQVTKKSLYIGIEQCFKGNHIGNIGYYIQKYVENKGFSVIRELVGHGIGKKIHENPKIPNYGDFNTGLVLLEGLVLSIEPMVNIGSSNIIFHNDGWTITTSDKKSSSHFEHNVAIINGQPHLLSTFQYIYDALNIFSKEEIPFMIKSKNTKLLI